MPPWSLNCGPLSIGSDGVEVKPQLLVGASCGNFHASAGVSDVRNILKVSAEATVEQVFKATGSSLGDFLGNLQACDGIADEYLNPVIGHIEGVVAAVIALVGIDVGGPCTVDGAVRIKTGIGMGGAAALGWENTEGYRMVGAGGEVAAGLHLGFSIFAGLRAASNCRDVKVCIETANIGIAAKFLLPRDEDDATGPPPPDGSAAEGSASGPQPAGAADTPSPSLSLRRLSEA